MTLQDTCFWLFKPTYERKGIQQEFKPVFARYIGTEENSKYPDILATFLHQCKKYEDKTILFDGEIPLGDAKIVSYFSEQLQSIDIYCIKDEDVELFENKPDWNKKYADTLRHIIALAFQKENFFNDNIKRNFIKKLIVWSYHYLRANNLILDDSINPKCIYYGDITRHEIYFLIMLYHMGFDVLYFNPLREEFWDEIETEGLSKLHKYRQILPIRTLKEYSQEGTVMEQIQSSMFQIERELETQMYSDGVYKPWQFRKGNTEPIFFHGTLIDLTNNYHEPAKVRSGFTVKNQTVTVPHFFQKIEGEYEDRKKYIEFVKELKQGNHVLLVKDADKSLLPQTINRDDMLSLSFCILGDGSCNIEKLKKCTFYPLGKYNPDVQNFILNKINEVLLDEHLFTCNFEKEDRLSLIMLLINLHPNLVRMIDNFDFPNQVPKLLLFLEGEEGISNPMQMLLAFLYKVGFDLVILNPAGLCSLSLLPDYLYDTIRLETMIYDENAENILAEIERTEQKENKCIWKKLFKY